MKIRLFSLFYACNKNRIPLTRDVIWTERSQYPVVSFAHPSPFGLGPDDVRFNDWLVDDLEES
jgi:hypothetical protein